MSRGAGAPPATAHWVADGPPTKVHSSPQASNSAPFRLILMDLTASRPLSGSLFNPADATSDEQERSDGRQGHGPQS